MLILSWNIAGLSTTVHRIHESYNPDDTSCSNPKSNRKSAPSVALREYLRRHGADIFCVQEHKIPRSQLSSRSEPRGCSTVEGYESFWSCCVDKDKRGLNGVVTYAKQGTVKAADPCPLGSEDLDGQGRCVMTDHGSFVLFNVYVPASGGQPLAYKMKFLHALRRAMRRHRQTKPVMLVGDLNISHTRLDIYWKDRVVHINDILQQVERNDEEVSEWKREVAKAWPKIVSALDTKLALATQTTNTRTGEKFDKFRLAVTVEGKRVYLGKHESSEEYCLWCYDLQGSTFTDPETNEERVASEANVVSVGVLAELMSKLAGIEWSIEKQRVVANSPDAGVRRLSPPRQWLNELLDEDDMVDTYRHIFPTSEARFTCWHQFTNCRYSNEGARIDYCLVDRALLHYVRKGSEPRCCCNGGEDPHSEQAALCAATANGAFKPVSFEGGGIQASSQAALDTQFGEPHTGIVYTPPSFSDHVGLSLLLEDACCPTDLALEENDLNTRKAQPHKTQKSIASFFSTKSATAASTSTKQVKRKHSTESASVRKKTVKAYFAPLTKHQLDKPSDNTKRMKTMKKKEAPTTTTTNDKKQSKGILYHFGK